MRILVTGAAGFVGYALTCSLMKKKEQVTAMVRGHRTSLPQGIKKLQIDDLTKIVADDDIFEKEGLISALQDCDIVVHCAARAHIMNDVALDPLTEFRKVNTGATLALAQQAAENGVKRFVFISSIKVNGEESQSGLPFLPNDTYVSTDPYGISKYEAEKGLLKLAKETGMEVVIIRPPLVYGPGVKANFLSMMKWMNAGIPLPFGAIYNNRSLVALDNLVDFIIYCTEHPKAANEVFLISDGEDVSTTDLLRKVANAFGRKALLLPIPSSLMTIMAKIIGKGHVANRLFSSLQVDSSKARNLLGWKPIITMDEQLKKTAKAYLNEKNI